MSGPVGGKKDDSKVQLQLVPPSLTWAAGTVFTDSVRSGKYGPNDWRKNPFQWMRVGGAALRHLLAWMGGENLDPESGRSHLWHLSCCVAMLIEWERVGAGTDDRFISEKAAKVYPLPNGTYILDEGAGD